MLIEVIACRSTVGLTYVKRADDFDGANLSVTDTARIGTCSRPHVLRKLDGRRREAKYLRRIERELTDHLGGADRVSVAQRLLIERVAIDLMRLELLDGRMAAGTITAHDGRVAHALRNSVRLALKDLGLQAAAAKPMDALEYGRLLAEREGRGAAA
jgi:hypothetical protein